MFVDQLLVVVGWKEDDHASWDHVYQVEQASSQLLYTDRDIKGRVLRDSRKMMIIPAGITFTRLNRHCPSPSTQTETLKAE
jgi:hypothetical protein